MDFEGIFDLFHLNQMEKAMDLLKKTNVTEKNKLQYTSTEMMILNSMEKYEQSIELGEKIWESDLTSENEFLIAIYYVNASISLSKIKNVSDKFGKLENKVVSNKREQISKFVLFRFYYLKGTLLLRSGELDEAMEITKLNQDLISQIPDHQSVNLRGIIHLRLGTIFDYMGKLLKATELYHKSEQEFKNNANQKFLMKSYQNLGNIYRLRGLIDDSIKYYTLSEEISQRQNDTIQIAQMSIEKGVNYIIKGDIAKALEKYKFAEEILKDRGPLHSFFIYGSYFELYADLQDYKMVKYYYDILEINEIYQERAYYKIHMEFYEGVMLKLSRSTRNKALAMNIFEKIAIGPLIDHTVTFQALIHYLDMLITDLIESEDDQIYEEVKNQINKIEKFANTEEISDLQAKSYLFKSKIALIEGNLDEAEKNLLEAKDIADEFGYTLLSMRISSEYDELYRLVNYRSFARKSVNNNFGDRLVDSKLNHLVTEYSLNKPRIVKMEESTPIHLFVTKFDKKEVIEISIAKNDDKDFISLINVIRTLLSAYDKPEDVLDRLDFNEYIIASHTYEKLVICIIYKGSSYQIGKYLEEIMVLLNEHHETDLSISKIQNASQIVIQNPR